MTEQDVRLKLLQLIEANGGSYKQAAKKLGYSSVYLGLIMRGEKRVPDPLLMAMGVRRVVTYELMEG